ncbi:FMN-dependent oxidoreductase, partial [Streptomyces sp. e14]
CTGMTVGATIDTTGSPLLVEEVVRQAREARASGLTSLWFGQTFGYDSPTIAAIVGREVPDIHLGTSALPVFGRHPLLVNSQAQTVQAATGGRYHLGLALGTKLFTEGAFRAALRATGRPAARISSPRCASLTETGRAG